MVIGLIVSFCLVLLVFILLKAIGEKSISSENKRYFLLCVIYSIITVLADGAGISVQGKDFNGAVFINYLAQASYFIAASVTCLFVYLLIDSLGGKPVIKTNKSKLIVSLPVIIYIIIVLISIKTGWIFKIDEEKNLYVRGPINFFQFLFCYSYILASLIISFYKYYKGSVDPNRDIYFANVLYCLMPTLGGVLQFAISISYGVDLPVISCGLTFSTIIMFIELVQNQVSLDSLTGLASRKAFYRYLHSISKSNISKMYTYMIDIDKFKNINDTYGHLEGDHALVLFAQALKEYTRKNNGLAARIGGDEFAIAVELNSDEANNYLEGIYETIENINNENDIDYHISASIGYSQLKEDESISDLIQSADSRMYRKKTNR